MRHVEKMNSEGNTDTLRDVCARNDRIARTALDIPAVGMVNGQGR
jgi:hypothetical protein